MRSALLVALVGALLPVAACGTEAKSHAAPVVVPSRAPAETLPPLPDYSADSQRVCARLRAVYSAELRDFGTAMGQMVGYKEAAQAADAGKAETTAAGKLKAVGAKIRQDTAGAADPRFRAAGETSAAKFEQSATDHKYLDRVNTLDELHGTLQPQMAQWLTPVSAFCEPAS